MKEQSSFASYLSLNEVKGWFIIMPSRKRLDDLEYNVFKKDTDDNAGGGLTPKNAGCASMAAVIAVVVVIIIVIVGFMQIGQNGPAVTCAKPGCHNRPKSGSSYCWLHSASHTGGSQKNNQTDKSSQSSGGSVIGGSSKDEKETKEKSKIWSGNTKEKDSASSSSSSSSSSSGGSVLSD